MNLLQTKPLKPETIAWEEVRKRQKLYDKMKKQKLAAEFDKIFGEIK